MAYDEVLADRVREALDEAGEHDEIKMFGGLAFMVNTHMACGIIGDDLMVKVGADRQDEAFARGAREMDFTGRPMKGFVIVPGELLDDEVLNDWVSVAVDVANSQPRKKPKKTKDS